MLYPFLDERIRQLVEQLKHKESLIALAKLTRTLVITPTSGEECFSARTSETYSRAFWDSIEILAQDRSEKNLQEMKLFKNELNIDGGDSYTWSTIVDRIPAPQKTEFAISANCKRRRLTKCGLKFL